MRGWGVGGSGMWLLQLRAASEQRAKAFWQALLAPQCTATEVDAEAAFTLQDDASNCMKLPLQDDASNEVLQRCCDIGRVLWFIHAKALRGKRNEKLMQMLY